MTASDTPPIRVLLCTDADMISAPVRNALARAPDIELTACVADGIAAVSESRRQGIDIVILDIGVGASASKTTLARLIRANPDARVLMVGSVSFANIRTSMQGLMAGAADFIATPTKHAANGNEKTFSDNLLRVLRGLGRRQAPKSTATHTSTPLAKPSAKAQSLTTIKRGVKAAKVLLIGSSTGGPQAVAEVLGSIGANFPLPILITQHMPKTFTGLFADNLNRKTGIPAHEAIDGETVQAGTAYIAPGGLHMEIVKSAGSYRIRLTDGLPVNFCKPAVDPMFTTAAKAYDGHVLAVVLTGMGYDGRDGARVIVDSGGTVFAQDEQTSVVWGMPGGVVNAGLAAEILPLGKIGPRIRQFI